MVGPRRQGAGSFVESGTGGAVEGGQAALFSGREFGGNLEGGQITQGVADFLEAMFQGDGVWGEGVGNRTAHRGQRVAQERALLAGVGHGKGAQ